MAKKVKATEVKRGSASRAGQVRAAVRVAGVAAFATLLGYGFSHSRRYADAHVLTPPAPPTVVFVDPPAWMNEPLRQRLAIVATPVDTRSSLDGSLVREVADVLAQEPWVKRVRQVRRVYGAVAGDTIEAACEFRTPVALVQDEGWFWMVDADGVKLPERFMKGELARVANGQGLLGMQLRVITGAHEAAPQAGERWLGEDVAAGLELAKLFHDKPYLNDVAMIDVAGVEAGTLPEGRGGRNEVVLHTKFGTQVRWGEPIGQGSFSVDVPVGQKLLTLERLYKEYGRVDAGRPWIEIRYDSVLYPSDAATESATTGAP